MALRMEDRVSKDNAGRQYELKFEDRDGYLFAHVKSDEITPEAGLDYVRRIVEKSRESNCDRVLLIRDIPNMLPLREIYRTAHELQEMFGDKTLAIVNPHSTIYGKMNFLAQAFQSRGGRCEVFESVADAEKWLLRG